ncbi:hypothetical protein KIW84_034570 [Lathyrus oleraceus]|uniref:Uncharacterized protein n=1 Tax=Pisum sativum TaxID=3888 RepID=A0A9D5B4Q8_PEA|nr:hypothetical protein KIW84_034570 [Pisum sativum]
MCVILMQNTPLILYLSHIFRYFTIFFCSILFTIPCENTIMDHNDHSLEEQELNEYIYRDGKQVLIVEPLNIYKTLPDQIGDYVIEQINIYMRELRKLDEREDLEHQLAIVVFKEDGKKKKRGREIKSMVIGPISISFELPHFCFDSKIDIEKLAAPRKIRENYGKDIDVTPLADRRFSIIERANNWTIELRKRDDNRIDIIATHLPSNKQFRTKPEVANFILYEALPKSKHKEKN